MSTIYRAAIIGTGRIGSTYDDEIVDPKEPSFYQGEMRHTGLYTLRPVGQSRWLLRTQPRPAFNSWLRPIGVMR